MTPSQGAKARRDSENTGGGPISDTQAELKALRRIVEAQGCPMTVIEGKRVIEGDLCLNCPWRPASAEYSRSDCWAVWRSKLTEPVETTRS